MARIRTIKPEFFTSEDIVGLSAFARLLYVALWCEADRDGRLVWRPGTYKLRYFPADRLHIDVLCKELIRRELVVLYGEDKYAYIPTFLEHQHVNPREAKSNLPEPPAPDASARVRHASARVDDAQGGREGKGKEGVETRQRSRGSRLPSDWQPSELLKAWAMKERPDLDLADTVERFRDYWAGAPGSKGVKLDWDATFRNWVRNEKGVRGAPPPPSSPKRKCAYCAEPSVGSVNRYEHCRAHENLAMDNVNPKARAAA